MIPTKTHQQRIYSQIKNILCYKSKPNVFHFTSLLWIPVKIFSIIKSCLFSFLIKIFFSLKISFQPK